MRPEALADERIRPEYVSGFRCIGAACEDTCCAGWSVFFDEVACERYEAVGDGPLKVLLDTRVERLPLDAAGSGSAGSGVSAQPFARVRMTEEKVCPFLDAERLCRIQGELGEGALSSTCATYPRVVHRLDEFAERSLALSCPEAARLVLLSGELVGGDDDPAEWTTPGECSDDAVAVGAAFWPIRRFVLWLIARREYPLWQRLFLVGSLTRRLAQKQSEAQGGELRGLFAMLRDFGAAVEAGGLRGAMEGIPADAGLQLDMMLRLAGMRLPRSFVGTRFVETVEAFKSGIGFGPGAATEATLQSLIAGYREAHAQWFEPYFREHSQMLENLLVNQVFRMLFPFGVKLGEPGFVPDFEREFALLAMHYALMKGLLIGVAGCHRESFSAEHVVLTVQSASKHFEHHPQFLDEGYRLLAESGLANARGLTMLLRN